MIEGQEPIQLLLMSYPNKISKEEANQFVIKNHSVLFKKE
jgi:hypothetical protein